MTTTETRTDQKAGFCGMCRGGSHALCASPVCSCPGKSHPNRPSAILKESPVGAPAPLVSAAPPVAVRWEEPPDTTRGRKPSNMFAPELLRELQANPGRWARVDDLKSKSGASARAVQFRKGKYAPIAPPLWEAAGRANANGSAFYLRFVGTKA